MLPKGIATEESQTERAVTVVASADKGVSKLFVTLASSVSSHALPAEGSLGIGRSLTTNVQIACSSVSRNHARLELRGRQMFLTDLDSANGTFIGAQRLKPGIAVPVSLDDVITIGSARLFFAIEHASGARPRRSAQPGTALHETVERVARSDISVLILGETGVGKEILAATIHKLSQREPQPLVCIHCGALPEQLLESELFGFERGAFTGASKSKAGLFESAERGTLFLDEIGELTLGVQVKLLRVLEERRVRRIGGLQTRAIEARIICATNRDLEAEVRAGRFRQDLFFRINGVSLTIPPLRERQSEFDGFVAEFLTRARENAGRPQMTMSAEAMVALRAYTWPGNLRELRNVVERAVVLCGTDEIGPRDLPESIVAGGVVKRDLDGPTVLDPVEAGAQPPGAQPQLRSQPQPEAQAPSSQPPSQLPSPSRENLEDTAERERVVEALDRCAGNQTRAARWLGLSRGAFVQRLDRFGIPRPRKPISK